MKKQTYTIGLFTCLLYQRKRGNASMIFASRETRTVKTGEKRNDGKKGPTPLPARPQPRP